MEGATDTQAETQVNAINSLTQLETIQGNRTTGTGARRTSTGHDLKHTEIPKCTRAAVSTSLIRCDHFVRVKKKKKGKSFYATCVE